MKEYEFFQDRTGCFTPDIYQLFFGEGESRKFKEFDEREVQEIFDHLLKFPEARTSLMVLRNHFKTKREILRQFIKCNWAIIDNKLDITQSKLNYEFVDCGFRGKCPFNAEGIVCIKSKHQE
ncbi:MAG: hypothetical protein KAT68_17845 [Bacteroidales bacterium]|nr:hypothetical protein [Bacteroidales bacterium]